MTGLLKGALGRARPVRRRTTPTRTTSSSAAGFTTSDRQSFPSGHTTTAFAAAAAVTSEMRRLQPEALWYVAPVLYGGATLVGLSRMYHNKHWASDVVLGAAIGTFSGLKVVRYSHAHPDNKLDRVHAAHARSPLPNGQLGVVSPRHLPGHRRALTLAATFSRRTIHDSGQGGTGSAPAPGSAGSYRRHAAGAGRAAGHGAGSPRTQGAA